MKRYIKMIAAVCLSSALAVSCAHDEADRDTGLTALESIQASLSNAAGDINAGDPTLTNIAGRAAAGHTLTVELGAGSTDYEYADGKWIPATSALQFSGFSEHPLGLTLSKQTPGMQDGTMERLLDADVLTYSGKISPVKEVSGIQLKHAKTLIEVLLEEGFAIDDGSDVIVNNLPAYRLPYSRSFQVVVEPGIEGFEIQILREGITYIINVTREMVTGGEFKANHRYRLTLTRLGVEVALKAISVDKWTEVGHGRGSRIVETLIEYGNSFIGGEGWVIYADGTRQEVNFPRERISLSTMEGDVIRGIKVGDLDEVLIGRPTGGTINFELTWNGDGLNGFRTDPSTQARFIGIIQEMLMIDSDGNRDGHYLQQEDIYLTNMEWMPLFDHANAGTYFEGVFDGNGKIFHDLYFPSGLGALFRNNGASGVIRNVNVASGYVGGTGYINTAGICAYNLGRIENCTNGATIEADQMLGGICAINEGEIVDCSNTGSVAGYAWNYAFAGGIAGVTGDYQPTARIEGCVNYGTISSTAYIVGGIVGQCAQGTVESCVNQGQIFGSIWVGGIAATCAANVYSCRNEGTITAGGQPGGIVGIGYEGAHVHGCVNRGSVVSSQIGSAGGIIAHPSGVMLVTNCVNYGTVSSSSGASGGVAGYNGFGRIQACANHGRIMTTSEYGGGVAGDNDALIEACYNTGEVTSMSYAGGVVGFNSSILRSSYSTGNVGTTATSGLAGGVVGWNNIVGKISSSYWSGNASVGVGNLQNETAVEVFLFSQTDWPADNAAEGWGLGNDYDSGKFWASMGAYHNTDPAYPELDWIENGIGGLSSPAGRRIAGQSLSREETVSDPYSVFAK